MKAHLFVCLTSLEYLAIVAGTYVPDEQTYNRLKGLDTKRILGLDSQNVVIKFQDTFRQFFVQTEETYKSFTKESMPFYLSYQDPTKVCFTRKLKFEKGLIQKTDLLWLEKFEVLNLQSHRF